MENGHYIKLEPQSSGEKRQTRTQPLLHHFFIISSSFLHHFFIISSSFPTCNVPL